MMEPQSFSPFCDRALKLHQLARVFSAMLRASLEEELVAEIIERNDAEEDPNVCHSHDFLDANTLMLDAFVEVFEREPCLAPPESGIHSTDPETMSLAWGLAIVNRMFEPPQQRVVRAERDHPADFVEEDFT